MGRAPAVIVLRRGALLGVVLGLAASLAPRAVASASEPAATHEQRGPRADVQAAPKAPKQAEKPAEKRSDKPAHVTTSTSATDTAPPTAPAREALAGLRSIDATSSVHFVAAPEREHTLKATYGFPARTRWWFGLTAESAETRLMRFEYGEAVYGIAPGAAGSSRLEGEALSEARMQLDLRRALLAWPHGLEWKREGRVARASLGARGEIEARFADADAERPTSLAFSGKRTDASELTPIDEYRAIVWRKAGDREKWWPQSVELWHAGVHVWNETITAVDVRTRFVDSFFVPPDRRVGVSGRPMEVGSVRAMDLPEQRVHRVALEPGTTWDAARAEFARRATDVRAELAAHELELEARATFEVDERAQPTAILWRLAPTARALPGEVATRYPKTPERPAFATFTLGLSGLDASRLELVRGALPADGRAGTPYVRFDPAQPDAHVLLILPLLERDD